MGNNRDMRFYNDGMARALEIAKMAGIEVLESEVKKRGVYQMPPNINSYQLKVAAREYAKVELSIVATAMADTLINDLKLPPSQIVDYLKKFNNKCDRFRIDPDEFNMVTNKLDKKYALNESIKSFFKEDK